MVRFNLSTSQAIWQLKRGSAVLGLLICLIVPWVGWWSWRVRLGMDIDAMRQQLKVWQVRLAKCSAITKPPNQSPPTVSPVQEINGLVQRINQHRQHRSALLRLLYHELPRHLAVIRMLIQDRVVKVVGTTGSVAHLQRFNQKLMLFNPHSCPKISQITWQNQFYVLELQWQDFS